MIETLCLELSTQYSQGQGLCASLYAPKYRAKLKLCKKSIYIVDTFIIEDAYLLLDLWDFLYKILKLENNFIPSGSTLY
jgi:hypothetical protein